MLNWRAILVWPWRFAFANRSQICADLSRLLLAFAFLELLTMPLTQQLWTWDRFLQGGGQDFELGLLVIVTCLCLVLLRAQHGRQLLRRLLAFCRLLILPFRQKRWPFARAGNHPGIPSGDARFQPPSGLFLAPLRI